MKTECILKHLGNLWLLKHHFLVPIQNAVPHGQSKQHLKPLLKISESVDCLVCTEEDLGRNILTDFASINWLTVSFQNIYTLNRELFGLRNIYVLNLKTSSPKKMPYVGEFATWDLS